jgi:hypothetical protein
MVQMNGEVDVVQSGAAVFFGYRQAGPAEAGHGFPERVVVAAFVLQQPSHDARGAFLFEQASRTLPQHFLLVAESEVHFNPRAISAA